MPPPPIQHDPDRLDSLRTEFRSSLHNLRETVNSQHLQTATTLARQDEALGRIEAQVRKTDHQLNGDGEKKKGMVEKVNTVHDAYENLKRLFWIFVSSVVGILVLAGGSLAFFRMTGHYLSQ